MTELIVCDTHHGGGNLLPEKLLQDRRITDISLQEEDILARLAKREGIYVK